MGAMFGSPGERSTKEKGPRKKLLFTPGAQWLAQSFRCPYAFRFSPLLRRRRRALTSLGSHLSKDSDNHQQRSRSGGKSQPRASFFGRTKSCETCLIEKILHGVKVRREAFRLGSPWPAGKESPGAVYTRTAVGVLVRRRTRSYCSSLNL